MPRGIYKHKSNLPQLKKMWEANRGREISPETRKKLSLANKGKKISDETKRKISLALKGNIISSETRKKISIALKGIPKPFTKAHKIAMRVPRKGAGIYKRTEQAKKNMSLAHIGQIPYNKGKKRPEITGVNHYRWKGGITPLVMVIRGCFETRQWRSDIFQRDNYTCVLCQKRGGYLEADHYPKMFSTIFRENKIKTLEEAIRCQEFWNINNGRTLCRKCHDKNKKWIK